MPAGDLPNARRDWLQRPRSWAIPIAHLGGIHLLVSFAVLAALAVLAGFAVVASSAAGDREVARAICLGVVFWASGWLVQAIVFVGTSRLIGVPVREICLGVVGVELGPRRWAARQALLISMATVLSLVVLGSLYRLIEGGFHAPLIIRDEQPYWSAPSLGFAEHDSIWRSAAWLCWVQAIFQLYPIPSTVGRQVIGAIVSLCAGGIDLPHQVRIFRRLLGVLSLITLGVAAASLLSEQAPFHIHWLVFFALAILLWTSSHNIDLGLILIGHQASAGDDSLLRRSQSQGKSPSEWIRSFRGWLQERQQYRRLQDAREREVGEAVDARKLDEILTRLHRHGMESLDNDDRKILERVSQSLRQRRDEGLFDDPPAE